MSQVKGLRERLRDGESVVCAEGYMWELEKRGYLQSGAFTPEVVLEHPEVVVSLHQEFVHAGSDVVEAFTYYAHRERLRKVGREDDLEKLNLQALRLARDVADRTGTLMAGNLCNSTLYDPEVPDTLETVRDMFTEQVRWAVQGGADYLIGETFNDLGEAKLALDVMLKHGNGLPTVITITPYFPDVTSDGVGFPEALRQLELLGADVVGLNCGRGPHTMLPLLREARTVCKGPLAAIPNPLRTTDKEKSFQSLTDPVTGEAAYPLNTAQVQCSRQEVRAFAEEAQRLGVQYVGLCCGNASYYIREVAEAYGKSPASSRFAPDLSKSFIVGDIKDKGTKGEKIRSHFTGWK